MLRFFTASLAVTVLLLSPALAIPTHDAPVAQDHAHSAFAAAHRHDWDAARAEAKQTSDPVLENVITWQYVQDPASGASFDDISRFLVGNPDWPGQTSLHIRAEQSLKTANLSPDDIINWFAGRDPVTGMGKIALAEALLTKNDAQQDRVIELVRGSWKDGDFDASEENRIATQYAKWLRPQDYTARIDRLLWEGKTLVAKRMLPRTDDAHRKLYNARIALEDDKKTSALAVVMVPKALKNDPGLIYDRMAYRARKGDDDGVREMLMRAPAKPSYPEKWWKQRESQIRTAIGQHNYTLAKKLLTNHGLLEGNALADALWLEGWLDCEFMDKPKDAYDIFNRMYDMMRTPVSRSRAAFWAARASAKSGDTENANRLYGVASSYPTSFYGQLASLQHNGPAPLHLPDQPVTTGDDQNAVESDALAKAGKLCLQLGEYEIAGRLLGHFAEHADNDAQAELAADIAMESGPDYISVHVAKKALQRGVVLIAQGYPAPKTSSTLAVERPLALAITRQESEFNPTIKSPSGAVGMMQLLPSTAKGLAKKLGMEYAPDRLLDPEYNMTLGSQYLARLIDNYNGSYVMAIAAYNAGPGNVHNWAQSFGTPGNNMDSAINWIEKIPFGETRNYVQRVLENVQLYRHIESVSEPEKLKLGEDLER